MTLNNKQKIINLLNSLETDDTSPIAYFNQENYKQHNLAIADGFAGFGELIQKKPVQGFKVNIVRVFQDGDYVFTHTEYDFFGPKIGFDIFRFEDGKIVEHWDNLQEPAQETANGHTMIDGKTEIADLNKTEENKELIKGFVEKFLVGGDTFILPDYILPVGYVQHNPQIADGLEGLQAALKYLSENGIGFSYTQIHKVLGEGNFVLVISEGQMAGTHSTFYDLFRVQEGRIAEHWDVIEAIPSASEWKNNNGKFGFK